MSEQKSIGPTFFNELQAYQAANGVNLIGQHFSWCTDGTLNFFDDTPANVVTGVQSVYAAHNPDAVVAVVDTPASSTAS
ncbi:hypothetical protein BX589_101210 [Paraburkholderia fungorum]|jgi:hypothetical protein|uniref:hypothetical protein n=1 Tax=Paraburkholderia fungorum TaxID=134537 RepID=UPI000D4405BE|nr:hypothetical protein [Paraburkholderia fungorum]PRZ56560.1 hypothetical protein BX589_101210 [Paraburkholderia fungorum]